MHDQRLIDDAEPADRREVLARIVRQLAVEARIDHEGGFGARQQGVAVGRGLGDLLGADLRIGSGLVLDQDLLGPGFRQPLRNGRAIVSAAPPAASGTTM